MLFSTSVFFLGYPFSSPLHTNCSSSCVFGVFMICFSLQQNEYLSCVLCRRGKPTWVIIFWLLICQVHTQSVFLSWIFSALVKIVMIIEFCSWTVWALQDRQYFRLDCGPASWQTLTGLFPCFQNQPFLRIIVALCHNVCSELKNTNKRTEL